MGSLRNPVGPLPSSIYWRRRAVALSLVAVLLLLVVWAFTSGGGGAGNKAGNAGQDDRGDGAASAITPGPTSSEPVISERPGGRDEDGESEGSDGDGDKADAGGGTAGAGGNGDKAGDGSDGGTGGSNDGKGSGGAAGDDVAGLAACRAGAARLGLESVKNSYSPGEKPRLRLTVDNTSGKDCRLDLRGGSTVITISHTDDTDKKVWASDHCPSGEAQLRVKAREKRTHTVVWDRTPSAPSCGTPSSGRVASGTYLAEVEVPYLGTAETSFVLAKD
ncbi:hypothetical protein [Streptomyces alkaliterrae]|uniref:DUF4232 domain-containing protein n=1 Tax=Streptomyces alkaliterrae TaxID=2213162 RepID=A0A5P0YXJ7_9ACTN|nr:hypothetical protein [Streptomyces alkaliterrae]MBB1261484.1 hypothetical protein [Streptomyces alkaliterrae]MQS04710.1 hypothetical protein [Streptomyces alkaliterrae]